MRKMPGIALLPCLFLAVCLVLFSVSAGNELPGYPGMQKAAAATAADGSNQPVNALFPELSGITAITIHTPERRFEFLRGSSGDICVNGQLADQDIYNTLVSQIRQLPVDDHAAFDPERAQLLLTLEITDGSAVHTARFYSDNATGEESRIVSGPPDAPQYHQTDRWRLGTLMMTCEGTRIQDERGNEKPANL